MGDDVDKAAAAVVDAELAAAFDAVHQGLDMVSAGGLDPVDARDAISVVEALEVVGRRVDAARTAALAAVDRRSLHRPDGHASAEVMVRHVAKLSGAEARARARCARALRDLPHVAAAWDAGEISTCHVRRISRVHANPRVRGALVDSESRFLKRARVRGYKSFDLWATGWVQRADEDGTCDTNQRTHQNRDAKLVEDLDRAWELKARGGSLSGAEMLDIFRHFVDAEFRTDWEKARIQHGDEVTSAHLERTDAQRRFDALYAIFLAAGSAAPGAKEPQVITNVVIDQLTFERQLARLDGEQVPSDDPNRETFRCSTVDGNPVDPTEAVAASLLRYVRRVVVASDGVVIAQGRKQRLFTGSAALAARLSSVYCYWPGCYVPASQCQIDHLTPYGDRDDGSGRGHTDPRNGGPACGRHNRHKEKGFMVRRDQAGEWHVFRPDGTQLL